MIISRKCDLRPLNLVFVGKPRGELSEVQTAVAICVTLIKQFAQLFIGDQMPQLCVYSEWVRMRVPCVKQSQWKVVKKNFLEFFQ
jgi:hypothetical protein